MADTKTSTEQTRVSPAPEPTTETTPEAKGTSLEPTTSTADETAPAAPPPPDPAVGTTVLLPPQHWQETAAVSAASQETQSDGGQKLTLELEDLDMGNDGDSAFMDTSSSTASLTSSILKYRTIQGRTFHSEQGNAHYWGANDERQNQAMDINHHCQTLGLDGKLFLAPVPKDIKKAVDIGTGTGIWAIDFADEFPGCDVVGTDISPIQPSWVPPNLEFLIDDCTQPWAFEENSLDYVHIRFLTGCIPDWNLLFKEAYRCLKPGGIIESMEPSPYIQSDDGTVDESSAMGQWGAIFVEGSKKMGRSFTVVQDGTQNTAMADAGFVDINEHGYRSPIGSWPKDEKLREIGQYAQLVMESDFEGLMLFMTNVLGGWTPTEIQVFIAHVRREIRSGNKHGYYWQKVVWARKPE